MTLHEYYQQQCQQGMIQSDPEQLAALDAFQIVFDQLKNHHKSSGLLRLRRPRAVKGLYVWGGVGIGKTLLMDCFFHCLPFQQKLRSHFHAFMQFVHQELKKHQGSVDPLQMIARDLSKKYRVICFDEFIVHDIVDAMLLARLLKALLQYGICFVTTSNTVPDELYKNGLQRTSFLPAIALINEHMSVVHVKSKQDYRMLQITRAGVFFTPDDTAAQSALENIFKVLTHGHEVSTVPLTLFDRSIPVVGRTDQIIWFAFNDICRPPRSQQDYLALAQQYKIILVNHVPLLSDRNKDVLQLFIRFIDVLYDAHVALILSAAGSIDAIFANAANVPEISRTKSRLMEMQSAKYLRHI